MNFIEIIDTFTYYGIDVALLAVVTAVITQVLKNTLLKNVQKKLITFLPFVLGTVLFAVYAAIRNLSILFVFEEYVYVLEHGISVGAAATLFYVLYEQFVRKDCDYTAAEGVVAELIEGYVPDEELGEAAKAVAEALAQDVTGNGADCAAEILFGYAGDGTTESEIKLLSRLIAQTLARLAEYA